MTAMSRSERAELCDDALLAGEDAPTLCTGWTAKDLVVHLLLREGNPVAAAGLVLPPLRGVTEAASRRLRRQEFAVLVERLRGGPPVWSPFALPRLEPLLNTLEYFVHHEDLRRARPGWQPRELSAADQQRLWKAVAVAGKGLTRGLDVGVALDRTDVPGQRVALHPGEPTAVVRGLPGEVALFVFGRKEHARVELDGPQEAVARLAAAQLSI